MSATVQAVHGMMNDLQIKMDKMSSSIQQKQTPYKDGSNSKRQRIEKTPVDIGDDVTVVVPDTERHSPRKIFNDQFRRMTDGYCSSTLCTKSAELFLYDWYAKNLGTVKGNFVTLTVGRWQPTVGHKLSTDNQGDGKNLIRLSLKLSSEEQIAILKVPQPDAAKDTNYTSWEMDMKGTAKTLTKLIGDFLTMKEGRVGNAKSYTVGALARRWKQLKYPEPTAEDILHL
jgi:hypothetical protein